MRLYSSNAAIYDLPPLSAVSYLGAFLALWLDMRVVTRTLQTSTPTVGKPARATTANERHGLTSRA